MRNKPILCLDFDGVCHSYSSGWQGAAVIPDSPVPGLKEFLIDAGRHFELHIFSSRSNQSGGIDAMRDWFARHDMATLALEFPKEKPPAFLTIDDRALTFCGAWPDVRELRRFKPWNKT